MRTAISIFVVCLLVCGLGMAQTQLTPGGMLTGDEAVTRTPEDMAAATTLAPEAGAANIPFRPTVAPEVYAQAKALAEGLAPQVVKAPLPLITLPLISLKAAFNGTNSNEAGGWWPPDSMGTNGGSIVTVVNNHVDVYSKTGIRQNGGGLGVSLDAFFGCVAPANCFDPRAKYDPVWKRYIITASQFPTADGHIHFKIAISKTATATGAWWIYTLDMTPWTGLNGVWDYPSLGFEQDAIVFTANVFNTTSYQYSMFFAAAKTRLYNGAGWSVPYWTDTFGTIQPTVSVAYNQDTTRLIALNPSVAFAKLYRLGDPAHPDNSAVTTQTINIPAWSVPPNASQPSTCGGTTYQLDTLDGRVQEAGAQYGGKLYAAHAAAFGTANVKAYRLNLGTGLDEEAIWIYETGTSSDWNPSITTDVAGRTYLTWSMTDYYNSASVPKIQYGGKRAADFSYFMATAFTSPTCYTVSPGVQRWGDYSAISLDAPNTAMGVGINRKAWLVNEKVNSGTVWGIGIAAIQFNQ